MKKSGHKKPLNTRVFLLAAFLIVAIVLGSMMLQKYLARDRVSQPPAQQKPSAAVSVALFFSAQDGTALVQETREVEESCNADISPCIRAVLEELATGPLGDLAPTIPQNSSFRSVRINGDMAIIDLGTGLVEGLPKGSSSEMTAVYSIVNTIAFNFPTIKRVRFLVDGNSVSTLDGHIDLSRPLEPNFGLEKQENHEKTGNSPEAGKPLSVPEPGGKNK
jgi:spore germination protein GerM